MIDVVCALIESPSGQLLACKRGEGKHLAGHWEFPGGKVEVDESRAVALRREIQEELGAEIVVGDAMEPVEWTDGKVAIRLLPYRCRLLDGNPHPHDHEEIRWCEPNELDGLKWAPADIPILKKWMNMR